MTRLNRIREVRKRESVSERTFARHLGIRQSEVEDFESPSRDMAISELTRVSKIFRCPVSDLVVDGENDEIVKLRGLLIMLSRSVNTLLGIARDNNVQAVAQSMRNQIADVMPEADSGGTLLAVGRRRGLEEMGRICENTVAFRDYVTDDRSPSDI
jgi:transcriptional regulator with XRE-family HTH domain